MACMAATERREEERGDRDRHGVIARVCAGVGHGVLRLIYISV